eukprot:gb/GECH01014287.1/.p1 GENE.gb/GECH01014287.1/~~gb/GECH01014287.1/.p1  ORF type:complete len:263 (+),score=78.56 gb/GECH01014287.1/:1-789(+)
MTQQDWENRKSRIDFARKKKHEKQSQISKEKKIQQQKRRERALERKREKEEQEKKLRSFIAEKEQKKLGAAEKRRKKIKQEREKFHKERNQKLNERISKIGKLKREDKLPPKYPGERINLSYQPFHSSDYSSNNKHTRSHSLDSPNSSLFQFVSTEREIEAVTSPRNRHKTQESIRDSRKRRNSFDNYSSLPSNSYSEDTFVASNISTSSESKLFIDTSSVEESFNTTNGSFQSPRRKTWQVEEVIIEGKIATPKKNSPDTT